MGSGSAKSLIMLFNKAKIGAHLFTIFTPGGIDFVGGFSFYHFLKANFAGDQSSLIQRTLGKLSLEEQNGEVIHDKLFVKKEVKTPAYWKQVVSYF